MSYYPNKYNWNGIFIIHLLFCIRYELISVILKKYLWSMFKGFTVIDNIKWNHLCVYLRGFIDPYVDYNTFDGMIQQLSSTNNMYIDENL